jgi:hypothetical protein
MDEFARKYTGIVARFNQEKGYGFIVSDITGKVVFELGANSKGVIAINVRVLHRRPDVYETWIKRLAKDVNNLRSGVRSTKNPEEFEKELNRCKGFLENIYAQAYLHSLYLTNEDEIQLIQIKDDLEYIVKELDRKRSNWWKRLVSGALLLISIVADLVTLVSPATGLLIRRLVSNFERLLESGEPLFLNTSDKDE